MKTRKQKISYIFSFTFVTAITIIYLFISIVLIPYWQGLSGSEIQEWWGDFFTRFPYLMVPVHLLSMITILIAFAIHLKQEKSIKRTWWLIALLTLFICQAFNFALHGTVYNPALQSGLLEPKEALVVFDNWAFYHNLRTLAVCISLVFLIGIGIVKTKKRIPLNRN
ncbi:MAG: hypothetical protein AAGB24_15880 [Bacteroidota bacterium]